MIQNMNSDPLVSTIRIEKIIPKANIRLGGKVKKILNMFFLSNPHKHILKNKIVINPNHVF